MRIIYLFPLVICLFVSSCKSPSKINSIGVLTGRAVYVLSDTPGDWRAAVGAKISAYQNDMEVSFAVITSGDGDFQINDLLPGVYDIVFTTPAKFLPGKIADMKIADGLNTLKDVVPMGTFSIPVDDSLSISVWFKRNVSDEEIQIMIAESDCKVIWRHSSLLTDTVVYNLVIPVGRSQLEMIEWFLKKNKMLDAAVGSIAPVDR